METVADIIEEVKQEICKDYCKYADSLSEEEMNEKCIKCPLSRLG